MIGWLFFLCFFYIVNHSASSRLQTSKFLEKRDGIAVQASKSVADERLKEDPLKSTVYEVLRILGEFSGLDGGGGTICGVEKDCFLGWRSHADVERHLSSVHPVVDVDVSWLGEGAQYETRHFL